MAPSPPFLDGAIDDATARTAAVDVEVAADAQPALAPDQHGAGDAVGDGADHERAAHRGADGDVVAVLRAAEQDGDERHDALGQGGAGSGQDRADGDGSDLEADAEPLDGVDEPLAREVDRDGAGEQQHDVVHAGGRPLGRAAGRGAAAGQQTSTHGSTGNFSCRWVEGLAHPPPRGVGPGDRGRERPSMSTNRLERATPLQRDDHTQ